MDSMSLIYVICQDEEEAKNTVKNFLKKNMCVYKYN